MIVAVLHTTADLKQAFRVAQDHPTMPLWCVYEKGSAAQLGDAAIRDYLRGSGYIDTKACAVSAQLTATRYHLRP
jgi:hypothetical protein